MTSISLKNKITKGMLFAMLMLATFKCIAQTSPIYSQYMYNMLVVNPAYAGNRGVVGFNTLFRRQWEGVPGAPQTLSVSLDGIVDEKGFGLGVQLYDDQLGVEKATGVNAMASTRIRISDNSEFSGGLLFGMMNYRAALTQVPNLFQPNDPAFLRDFNKWMPSVGAGIFYNTSNFYLGVSIPDVLLTRLAALDVMKPTGIGRTNEYHVFITSGAIVDAGEYVKIKPSMMVKAVSGAPLQLDFNTNLWYKDIIGLGVSYRSKDAVIGMLEMQVSKQFRLGYAYEMAVSALKSYTTGTHEVMFRYEFGRNANNVKSTRYF